MGLWVCCYVRFVRQLLLAKNWTSIKKPHPSSIVPINTIIGCSLHLRGSPVKKRCCYKVAHGYARLHTSWLHGYAQLQS